MQLTDFDTLTFDCYGTLIDWESGILAALRPWLAAQGCTADDERVLAAMAAAESAQQRETPGLRYPALLAKVHARIAGQFGLAPDPDAAAAFGGSVPDWPAFPDSAAALAYLKRHYRLVVLSNVDNRSFAASSARLGVAFDAVYTAEDVGAYKPDARNFAYLLDKLAARGVRKETILHTAQSLFHDHRPAQAVGLATCWIDRRDGRLGGATAPVDEPVTPDLRFDSMAALADAHRALTGG